VLDAEEKILTLEKELFTGCASVWSAQAQRIRATATAVAELDVTAALAQWRPRTATSAPHFPIAARCASWPAATPSSSESPKQEAGRFIPTDLYLNDSADLIAIITGPNMGGKSTYLRQAALIAILAQMGSFVPADSASLAIIDRIFTRIGASDNLARVPLHFHGGDDRDRRDLNTATPAQLHRARRKSGRGTATYDGLALAWAVVEHIHSRTRAKTLFATHYHELTSWASCSKGVRNLSVSVKEAGDHIIFLRKVEPARRPQLRHRSRALGRPAADRDRARPRVLKSTSAPNTWSPRTRQKAKRARCRSSFSSPWVTASPSAYGP